MVRFHRNNPRVRDDYDEFGETMPAAPANYYEPAGARPLYMVELIVRLVVGVVNALLAVRFFLELLAANSANGFASFIYNVTDPLVRPFVGLFNYTLQTGVVRFDLPALVAIIVYTLIAYVIIRLLSIGRV